jgi:hypothetical protein
MQFIQGLFSALANGSGERAIHLTATEIEAYPKQTKLCLP